jgi:hypothetical protein
MSKNVTKKREMDERRPACFDGEKTLLLLKKELELSKLQSDISRLVMAP